MPSLETKTAYLQPKKQLFEKNYYLGINAILIKYTVSTLYGFLTVES